MLHQVILLFGTHTCLAFDLVCLDNDSLDEVEASKDRVESDDDLDEAPVDKVDDLEVCLSCYLLYIHSI